MSSRAPLLFGGSILVLLVGATVAIWFSSGPGAASAAGGIAGETYAAASGPVRSADVAQTPIPLDREALIPMMVYLSPTCECCSGWVQHVADYGFEIDLQYRVDMVAVKEELGVRPELSSCHTAVVNGYVLEGHIPGDVVRRFLAEAPAVRGIAVPGMPVGSPGMEVDGAVTPYDVLTFTSDGRTEIYSSHGRS